MGVDENRAALSTETDNQLSNALPLMRQALALLDDSGIADNSSLHLHLAIERLNGVMAKD